MANNRKLVPACQDVINEWKYEFAAELNLPVGKAGLLANTQTEFASELGTIPASGLREDYWGHISARDAGFVGGNITARLIEMAEKSFFQS